MNRFAIGNVIGNLVAFVPLGGLVGILFLTLLRVLLRRWSRLITVMAALSVLTVPILYYFLFAIRLRM